MRCVRRLLVATVLLAACGGAADDGVSGTTTGSADPGSRSEVTTTHPTITTAAPDAAPSSTIPPSVATTRATATSAPVATAPPTTDIAEERGTLAILRPDGIASVDFGTPGDDAIAVLDALLGPPSHDVTLDADRMECVEGGDPMDCLGADEHARRVTWTASGLEILVTDARATDEWSGLRREPYFGAWSATLPADASPLTTVDGFGPGALVAELEQRHPDVVYDYGEGIIGGFTITTDQGALHGSLDWVAGSPGNDWSELVGAVQRALNEHGADIAVDGEWGPLSQAAWETFWREHGLGIAPGTMWLTPAAGQALGLPPADFVVGRLMAFAVTPAADTTPPTLSVVDPVADAWVASAHYRFTGWTDPGARVVAAGRYPVDVDPTGRWSIVLVLVPGRNVATFEATDAAGNSTTVRVPVHLEIPFTDLIVGTWRGDVTVPTGWTPIEEFWVEFRADGTYSAGATGTSAFYYGSDEECADKTYEVWGTVPSDQPGSGTITVVFDCGPVLNSQPGTLREIRFSDDHQRLQFEFWNTWKGSYGPVVYDLERVGTTS